MKFKKDVQLSRDGKHVTTACVEGMMIAAKVYAAFGITGERATITSVMDGEHRDGSIHYEGNAFDVRTWFDDAGNQLSIYDKQKLAAALRFALGDDWDVVIENTHIHCEYDPK